MYLSQRCPPTFSVLREADLIASVKHGRVVQYHLKLSVLEEALLEFAQLMGIRETRPDATKTTKRLSPTLKDVK